MSKPLTKRRLWQLLHAYPYSCYLAGKLVGRAYRLGRQDWAATGPKAGEVTLHRSKRNAVAAVLRRAAAEKKKAAQ